MHPLALGKRQSSANQPPEPLPERVVETFHIAGFPVPLVARAVLIVGDHRKIRLPEVRKAVLAAIPNRNVSPKTTTGGYRPFPDRVPDDLARTAANRKPHVVKTTSRLTLTRPQAQQGAEIDAGAGSDGLFFIQSASVWRLIPRTRATPRIEACS